MSPVPAFLWDWDAVVAAVPREKGDCLRRSRHNTMRSRGEKNLINTSLWRPTSAFLPLRQNGTASASTQCSTCFLSTDYLRPDLDALAAPRRRVELQPRRAARQGAVRGQPCRLPLLRGARDLLRQRILTHGLFPPLLLQVHGCDLHAAVVAQPGLGRLARIQARQKPFQQRIRRQGTCTKCVCNTYVVRVGTMFSGADKAPRQPLIKPRSRAEDRGRCVAALPPPHPSLPRFFFFLTGRLPNDLIIRGTNHRAPPTPSCCSITTRRTRTIRAYPSTR